MNEQKDKYDAAISYLTAYPNEIRQAWTFPQNHPAGCLFQFVTPTGALNGFSASYSCLTAIRLGHGKGWTPEITERIKKNESIPCESADITIENLIHFAEEQRRLDKEIRQEVKKVVLEELVYES